MNLVRRKTPLFPADNLWNEFFHRDLIAPLKSDLSEFGIPPTNIKESDNQFIIELAVPGMSKENFTISVENNSLAISSEKQNENEIKEENYTRKEFGYRTFKQSFKLPKTVEGDKVSANYRDGILSVSIPKNEEMKPKPVRMVKVQ